jgi:hypothetical protein
MKGKHGEGKTERKRVPGTCEKIGFANFRTTYFHQVTLRVTDGNSIFSHVPDTVSCAVVLRRRSQRGRISAERVTRLFNRWLPPPRLVRPYPIVRSDAMHPR